MGIFSFHANNCFCLDRHSSEVFKRDLLIQKSFGAKRVKVVKEQQDRERIIKSVGQFWIWNVLLHLDARRSAVQPYLVVDDFQSIILVPGNLRPTLVRVTLSKHLSSCSILAPIFKSAATVPVWLFFTADNSAVYPHLGKCAGCPKKVTTN